ncbi:4-hydroxyphenylacetate 3-monooxygenase [Caballeronia sp. LjRoot34]|uniref:4-hydroxyphenylacetate 3-hydroxylase family protein n=1 Tax=Caballeronia sp. LjRoot34 TaxID=3342325 RepID=UPI003ECF27EB
MVRVKDGSRHLASLKDGRDVYINGGRVDDVTTHAAFRNSVQTAASLYDFQAAPENIDLMTYVSPDTHDRVNRAWQLPTCYRELVERRNALEQWSEVHFGFLGRSPDHVACCISGMYMGIDLFEQYDKRRAQAVREYYRYARDNDLYLSYVIVNPQADQSRATHEQADPYLTLGVVDEDAQGITVRGAKMLATAGIMSNELFVGCVQPMRAGDERYAVSFAVPMNTKGLRIVSRKSYEESATSVFDNPLSSHFDENDAIVYFDDVKVEWDRVFVNQDIEMTHKQFHDIPVHVYQNYQCQIRLLVKMRFLAALGKKMTEVNGTNNFPQVKETLGQLAAEVGLVEGLMYGMEAKGQMASGYFMPDRALLYSAQVLTQQLYPKVIHVLRELAGGGMIMLPSSVEDFANPMLAEIIYKTQKSSSVSPEERVKFFKLAWDAVGSEFGSRHLQYEMFYNGANFVTRANAYRTFDWTNGAALLNRLLNSYPTPSAFAKRAAP